MFSVVNSYDKRYIYIYIYIYMQGEKRMLATDWNKLKYNIIIPSTAMAEIIVIHRKM